MNAQIVAIILAVGSLLPLLTSVAQQPHWSNRARVAVGVGLSLLAGLVTYVTQYGLEVDSWANLVTVVVGIILAAAAAYKTIWQPSQIAGKIELATSRTDGVVEEDGDVVPLPDARELEDGSHPLV